MEGSTFDAVCRTPELSWFSDESRRCAKLDWLGRAVGACLDIGGGDVGDVENGHYNYRKLLNAYMPECNCIRLG
jgi:hypothetical protein